MKNCQVLTLFVTVFPASIYLFRVNNRNNRRRCKICSKLTIKTLERRQWHHCGIFIVTYFSPFCTIAISIITLYSSFFQYSAVVILQYREIFKWHKTVVQNLFKNICFQWPCQITARNIHWLIIDIEFRKPFTASITGSCQRTTWTPIWTSGRDQSTCERSRSYRYSSIYRRAR